MALLITVGKKLLPLEIGMIGGTAESSQTLTKHDPVYYGFHQLGMVHGHLHCVHPLCVCFI